MEGAGSGAALISSALENHFPCARSCPRNVLGASRSVKKLWGTKSIKKVRLPVALDLCGDTALQRRRATSYYFLFRKEMLPCEHVEWRKRKMRPAASAGAASTQLCRRCACVCLRSTSGPAVQVA